MAITRQSLTQATSVGAQTSLTTAVTVNAGTDRVMVVAVHNEDLAGGTVEVSGITFGGVALTLAPRASHANWSNTEMWYLVAPAVSTANVVTTVDTSNPTKHSIYVLDGVDQATPLRAVPTPAVAGSGTSCTLTIAGATTGDYLIDALTVDGTGHSATAGANQTEEYDVANNGGCDCAGSTQAGADGGVMSWTWTTSAPNTFVAIGLIPSGGTPVVVKSLGALGVG